MSEDFGQTVAEQGRLLAQQGKDANQIAKILCDRDPEGYNYGIGIIVGGDGKPLTTSSTLSRHAVAELERCSPGEYFNSSALLAKMKAATLRWQRVPEEHWDSFSLALPSDAGTGAVISALETALLMDPSLNTLGVEKLGWPAYKTMSRVLRLGFREYDEDAVMADEGVLPVYQAGPMNTTGFVKPLEVIEARAKQAAASNRPVILDRAYSGFEFARLLESEGYDAVMRRSYELQLKPFIDAGARFCLAVSPTKAFVTFSLRPAGLLLVYDPDRSRSAEVEQTLVAIVRARGSSFEHPITRAFARSMSEDLPGLEGEHEASMQRMAKAEALWRELVKGTPIEYLYSDSYAGLFRNPPAKEGAEARIYGEHIYPVFSAGRCRQNITGIPDDRALAAEHVAVFARECY